MTTNDVKELMLSIAAKRLEAKEATRDCERRELIVELYNLYACLNPLEIINFINGAPSWNIDDPALREKLLNVQLSGHSEVYSDAQVSGHTMFTPKVAREE